MITVEEMKNLEERSESLGVSKLQLMENAGNGIYNTIKEKYPDLWIYTIPSFYDI